MRPLFIFWYALTLHILQGVPVLMSIDATRSTPVYALLRFLPTHNHVVLGLVMICASIASIIAMRSTGNRLADTALMLPQQILLLVSAGGSVAAILASQYADGTPAPLAHILTDQIPGVIAAVLHSYALLAENINVRTSLTSLIASLKRHASRAHGVAI
jgi:hypothetical protein